MIKDKPSSGELKTVLMYRLAMDHELILVEHQLEAGQLRLRRNKIQERSLCIILSAKYR